MRSLFSSLALVTAVGFAVACSSKQDTTPVAPGEDTGTEETAVEDTAPPPWATYPEGPYGLNKGDVFPNLELDGYKGGIGGPWDKVRMIDYYDPDGSRGYYAILYVVSAEWCNPCRQEAKVLPGFYNTMYHPRGAAFIETLIEQSKTDASGSPLPADRATVDRWLKSYALPFDTAMDPTQLGMPKTGSVGIPRNYIINPRDMRVYRVNSGTDPTSPIIPGLKPLLDYNGAPPAPDLDAGTDAAAGG